MRRRSLVIAWSAGAISLLIALLAGLVLIGGNTEGGRKFIEQLTDRLSSGHVQISGLQGSFPAEPSIAELRLSDQHGVWLKAERVSAHWNPWALLAHRIEVGQLAAARVAFERLPVSESDSKSPAAAIPTIEIAAASIEDLQLSPALAGTQQSLELHGSVLLRSLEDAGGDLSAQRIGSDGRYDLHFHFDRQRMDGRLQVHESAAGPLQNLLQLPGLGALSASVTIGGVRSAEHLELQVDAGEMHGRARGEIDLTQGSADLDYSLTGAPMQPRADLGWRSLALHGSWHGTPAAPRADGELHVEQLQLPGGWGVADLTASLSAAAATLSIDADAAQLRVPESRWRFLQQDPLHIHATIAMAEAARPLRLQATTRLFTLDAQAVTAGQESAVFTVRVDDLRPFAALAGEALRGSALVKGELAEQAAGLRLAIDANALLDAAAAPGPGAGPGESAAQSAPPGAWRKFLGQRPSLQLTAAWSARRLAIEHLQLTGRAATLSVHGDASRAASGALETLGLHWNLELADLGLVSTALSGRAAASGELAGPVAALVVDGKMTSMLSVHGSPLGALSGAIKLRGWPDAPNARIALHGEFDDAPLQLEASVDRSRDGSFRATISHGDWKSVHLQGALTIGPTSPPAAGAAAPASGRLDLHVAELGDLEHLLGAKVDGNADLSCEGGTDSLQLRLNLQLADLGAAPGTAARTLHGALPAALTASATLYLERRKLRLASLEATSRQQSLQLLAPAEFSFDSGLTVDRLRFGMQQAQLTVSGGLLPSLDLHASLRQVGPAFINAFMPGLLADGVLTADAELSGSLTRPIGRIRMDAAGIRFASDLASGLPAAALRANLVLETDAITIDGELNAGPNSRLLVRGKAPLDSSGLLALQVDGKLDIGLVSPLLEARGLQTAGDLDVAMRIGGTAAAPDIGGTIRLTKASLRDYVRGIRLSDISAQFSGSQGALKIDRFTARAAAGTVSLSGTVGFLQARLPVDLQLSADHAEAIANSLITANLDAALKITGSALERLEVRGNLQIHRATIGIPSALPPDVAVLDVRRRGQPPSRPLAPQLVIALDVAVHAPNEILVQGRGLDAELGGDLKIAGTVDAPTVSGGFDLLRGNFAIAGNTLNFKEGRVSFDGAGLRSKLDPTLDFTAQKVLADTTATLRITGLADAPKFDFSGNPPMPQDEILARLLFGVPAAQLTPLMAAQIGGALAVLSVGGDGGFNPLTKLQKSLGLDRLLVGSNATAATPGATPAAAGAAAPGTTTAGYNVSAGRYIAKRVYVEAKQSTTGSTQLQVDVDLSKHLKLQTRLGNGTAITQGTTPENDPGSSIGLTYQIEY